MKWIGQHIYDLISRFRNDVYLEDISTGTIASGGNLGLDSNNKIVKATSQDQVTLAGTPNYITISGQEITRNAIDLAADVTGVLPSANMDSDTAHLSGNQIFSDSKIFSDGAQFNGNVFFEDSGSSKPFIEIKNTNSDATSSVLWFKKDKGAAGADGDNISTMYFSADNSAQEQNIFSSITTEVGTAADTDEAGKLSVKITASDGSATGLKNAFVLTGHGTNDIVDASVGHGTDSTTTIAGNLTVNSSIRGKSIYVESCNFSDDLGTTEHFIPFVTVTESPNFSNVAVPWIAPVAGKLLKVHWRSSQHDNISSNEMSFRLYKISDGTRWSGTNESLLGTKVVTGPARTTHAIADFTSGLESGAGSETNAFAANDLLGVSIQHSQAQGITEKVTVTLVFELDFSSY